MKHRWIHILLLTLILSLPAGAQESYTQTLQRIRSGTTLVPPKSGSSFRLFQVLGRGAHVKVFLAIQENTGQAYAAQIMHDHLSQENREELIWNHDKIIQGQKAIFEKDPCASLLQIHEVAYFKIDGMEAPVPIFLTELAYLNLETLIETIGQSQKDSWAIGEVLYQTAQAGLSGLSQLHSSPEAWVHRDVKAPNFLIAPSVKGEWTEENLEKIGSPLDTLDLLLQGKARVLLSDFGITTPATSDQKSDLIIGTPDYIAPEIFTYSNMILRTSDFYSLGVVLYRGLTLSQKPIIDFLNHHSFLEERSERLADLIQAHRTFTSEPSIEDSEMIIYVTFSDFIMSEKGTELLKDFEEFISNTLDETIEGIERKHQLTLEQKGRLWLVGKLAKALLTLSPLERLERLSEFPGLHFENSVLIQAQLQPESEQRVLLPVELRSTTRSSGQ